MPLTGRCRRRADGTHAGKSLCAIDEAIEKSVALFGLGVGGLRERKIGDEKMIGLEAGADVLQA